MFLTAELFLQPRAFFCLISHQITVFCMLICLSLSSQNRVQWRPLVSACQIVSEQMNARTHLSSLIKALLTLDLCGMHLQGWQGNGKQFVLTTRPDYRPSHHLIYKSEEKCAGRWRTFRSLKQLEVNYSAKRDMEAFNTAIMCQRSRRVRGCCHHSDEVRQVLGGAVEGSGPSLASI